MAAGIVTSIDGFNALAGLIRLDRKGGFLMREHGIAAIAFQGFQNHQSAKEAQEPNRWTATGVM